MVEGHVPIQLGYCLDNLVTVIVLVLIPMRQQALEMKRPRGFEFDDKLGLVQLVGIPRDPYTVWVSHYVLVTRNVVEESMDAHGG